MASLFARRAPEAEPDVSPAGIYADAIAAARALNFDGANAQIARIEAEISRNDDAAGKARIRIDDINTKLSETNVHNPVAMADALLSSPDDVVLPMAGRDALEEERQALTGGVRELDARNRKLHNEIDEIRRRCASKAVDALKPLTAALVAEASEHAAALHAVHMTFRAMEWALGARPVEAIKVRNSADGLNRSDTVLRLGRDYPVPAEFRAVLDALADKGPALRVGMPPAEIPH